MEGPSTMVPSTLTYESNQLEGFTQVAKSVYIHTGICMYVCMYVYAYVYTYTAAEANKGFTRVAKGANIHPCICMYVCMYMNRYIHIHISG